MLKQVNILSFSSNIPTSQELKLVDARGYKQAGGKGLLLYGNRTVCGDGGFDTTEAEEICKDMG